MNSLEDTSYWDDFLDYSFIENQTSSDFNLPNRSDGAGIDVSCGCEDSGGVVSQQKDCTRKRSYRGRNDSCSRPGTKADRERLRRERMNDRFLDLSSILEPGRPIRTDKPAILDDAIRVLNQLRTEAQRLKEANEKLVDEIKNLKAEKNELREEKLALKADKERMEQQLKAMTFASSGFAPAHPATYHAGANKMAVFPSYGLVPMWQYLPASSRDTSRDHELRPPAA